VIFFLRLPFFHRNAVLKLRIAFAVCARNIFDLRGRLEFAAAAILRDQFFVALGGGGLALVECVSEFVGLLICGHSA